MSQIRELINAVKLGGLTDLQCFKSFGEFVQALTDSMILEIPTDITNVVVGNIEPTDTQRTAVWFRKSNGGTFIGIYLYSDGAWRQFFPVPKQVYKLAGADSRNVPEGFILASDSSRLTAAQKTKLQEEWLKDPTDTYYVIFHVVPIPV